MHTPRDIWLTIQLVNGQTHEVVLREDAPELVMLYSALASPSPVRQFVQLPIDGGREAWSFQTSHIFSITSRPPVVLDLGEPSTHSPRKGEPAPPPQANPVGVEPRHRPRVAIIDHFLSQPEHDAFFAYLVASEAHFHEAPANSAVMNFPPSVHRQRFENRLLTWLPVLAKHIEMPLVPLEPSGSQITAGRDGCFREPRLDTSPGVPHLLTCMYFLHREPRGFSGGELRLYETLGEGQSQQTGEPGMTIRPAANRLVLFRTSEVYDALTVRCPSGQFADSRFAVTLWLHQPEALDPHALFGFGLLFRGALPRAGGPA